ncbi:tether containing UBX domain for GLUT4 [Culex pipiens pallens]|uniref:tether containing UBX domain for GLUT4 n=1 Tax=Culex pipiens pallens TaxID=42434 RepID=UPI0019546A81|nr:tether containing UBX domain for GLUT4 [Culex pipiens pallens]
MATTSRTVTVLTINGRRQNVKVEPNTTVLEILEQVCAKHNFNAAEYDLKHHNKVMDLSAMFRFSGLPNNALLEMTEAKKIRTEADVQLAVQLEDGSRLDGTFKPSSSLLDVLKAVCADKANSESNPVMIYMRKEVQWEAMDKTTLKSLGLIGGRAIIRLLQRKPEELRVQANVSAPLPQKERPEEKEELPYVRRPQQVAQTKEEVKPMEVDLAPPNSPTAFKKQKQDSDCPQPGPSTVKPKQLPEPDLEPPPVPIIHILGDRDAVLFHVESAEQRSFELPDSFFDVTVADVRRMYADLRNKVKDLDEAPLMTTELRQLEDSKRVLNDLARFRVTAIRVQFPDRHVLQGIFKLHETVADVRSFVASFLQDSTLDFHLFTTPPKQILGPESTLVEAKCVPQALLHFGLPEDAPKQDKFLQPALYEQQLSNAAGAAVVVARSRGQVEPAAAAVVDGATSANSEQEQVASGESGSGMNNRLPNANFRPSSVQQQGGEVKLPKWFKPLGK